MIDQTVNEFTQTFWFTADSVDTASEVLLVTTYTGV